MTHEALAIIGMSCRFPGAPNLEGYWRLLESGGDAITTVPPDRWDVDYFYDRDIDAPGKLITRWGGFVDHPARFDAEFFGVSAKEAERIDPQQRLALEVSWEALEDACIPPDSLSGTDVGVFMGVSHSDYERIIYKETAGICAHDGPGAYHALTANRVSFALNLKGPSLVVDGACSSSLAAVHIASQHLLLEECSLAIVGGVNLNLTPEETIGLTKARMMSPTGRCMTFDARADGYVRGEGVGVLVLKRASQALRDGDRIRALIRGSAVNHNGRSNGVTAPNGPAQQALLKRALQKAEMQPAELSYVEVHGTATSFGDAIEVGALKAVLGPCEPTDSPCYVGTVKTNIGHLEAASGVAGLIKVVLAFEHGLIPRSLHFETLSRYIDLSGTRLRVADEAVPWPVVEQKLAGVSAFGFGGANAHVLLQGLSPIQGGTSAEGPRLLLLSARNRPALFRVVTGLDQFLLHHPDVELADVCYSASIGRSHFDRRLALVCTSLDDLRQQLARAVCDQLSPENEPKPFKPRRHRLGLSIAADAQFWAALAEQSRDYLAMVVEHAARLAALRAVSPSTLSEAAHRLALPRFIHSLGLPLSGVEQAGASADCAALLDADTTAPTTRASPHASPVAPSLWITLGSEQVGANDSPNIPRLKWNRGATPFVDTLHLAGELYELGALRDFTGLARLQPGRKVGLPTYPFEPNSYWVQPVRANAPAQDGNARGEALGEARHG